MILKRKIEEQLLKWKNSPEKKALIVQGARQVGKTFSIRAFAKANYKHYLELNFILNPQYKQIFSGNLKMTTLLMNLNLYTGFRYDPNQEKALLFLDEIQACPEARTALKTLTEDGRFDVIASGSLLGIRYHDVPSFPTGYVTYLSMFPLDFEEYLWANGIDTSVIGMLRDAYHTLSPIHPAINNKMHEHFRNYMVVGGMPESVKAFADHHDYQQVLTVQRDILRDYRNDIAKYAEGTEKLKAAACFDSMPAQLGRENKKFKYSTVEKGGRSSKFLGSVNWLVDAGIALISHNLSSIDIPLRAYEQTECFKLYMNDTGLLTAMLDDGTNIQILNGNMGTYKGAVYENAVAQSIACMEKYLYYHNRLNSLELDFVLAHEDRPYVLEVKAGSNYAKSLSTYMSEPDHAPVTAIKLMTGNIGGPNALGHITLPVYMVMFL